jgi:hypothetical protein
VLLAPGPAGTVVATLLRSTHAATGASCVLAIAEAGPVDLAADPA